MRRRFADRRLYWVVRRRLKRSRLRLWSWRFGIRHAGTQFVQSTSAARQLYKGSLLGSLGAIALAMILQFIVGERWPLFPFSRVPDRDSYVEFLVAATALTGVFLALYLAAVASVAGSLFARLPASVRLVLVQDRVGNLYVRVLAFVTAYTMATLALAVVAPPSGLQLGLVLLLIVPTVFAFGGLVRRVFRLFDPTTAMEEVRRDILRDARFATAGSGYWNKTEFQDFLRARSQYALRVISDLHGYVKGDSDASYRSEAFGRLRNQELSLLIEYRRMQARIPQSSRWNEQVPVHSDWYLASHTRLNIATQTGTSLQPEERPDPFWLDRELTRNVDDLARVAVEKLQHQDAVRVLDGLSVLYRLLGRQLEPVFAREHFDTLAPMIIEAAIASDCPQDYDLALVDHLALLPIALAIGIADVAEELDIARLDRQLSSTSLRRKDEAYALNLPRSPAEALAGLVDLLGFERRVEGVRVTPPWFIRQVAFSELKGQVLDSVQVCVDWYEAFFVPRTKDLTATGNVAQAGILATRGIELVWKVLRHLDRVQSLCDQLDAARLDRGMRWPEHDLSPMLARMNAVQTELHRQTARLIPGLQTSPVSPTRPDQFSEAVHRTGEFCFDCLATGAEQDFRDVFPAYFAGVLQEASRLAVLGADPKDDFESLGNRIIGPILDLLALSGYAHAWAEFHSLPGLVAVVSDLFDTYLEGSDGRRRAEWLLAVVQFSRSAFRLTSRDIQRTNWRIALDRRLAQLPEEYVQENGAIGFDKTVEHDSKLIRVLAEGTYGSMYDGIDIFTAYYFKTNPVTRDLGWKSRRGLEMAVDLSDEVGSEDAGPGSDD